jgi:hypothetical protein
MGNGISVTAEQLASSKVVSPRAKGETGQVKIGKMRESPALTGFVDEVRNAAWEVGH